MPQLLDLSAELVICISSHLRQVDLLNVSLTCKYLRETTECELFREYRNRLLGKSHPVSKFVYRVLRKPELARYVKSVNVKGWNTLDYVDPAYHERRGDLESQREDKSLHFMEDVHQPNEEEYRMLTAAAKTAGIINNIFPYETESSIIKKAAPMLSIDPVATAPNFFYTHLFDDAVPMDQVPYDQKFCQILRVGIDDAYAILLFAILPHVKDMFLRGACSDPTSLAWPKPNHGFKALRRLRAACVDMELTWGIGYLNNLLDVAVNVNELLLHGVASWYAEPEERRELDERARPVILQPGSLNITKLEMLSSALTKTDMSNLINACPKLKSLHYYTGSEDTGPYNFGPQDLVEILDPVKDTLEELYIGIFPYWTDVILPQRILSMSHFSALRVLASLPSMWENMTDEDFDTEDEASIEEEDWLSVRLPPSLTTLVFPLSEINDISDEEPVHPSQIIDVIVHRADRLPSLKKIIIVVAHELDAEGFGYTLDQVQEQMDDLEIKVALPTEAEDLMVTFMDNIHRTTSQPITKWVPEDKKYAIRREKEREYDSAISEICNRPEHEGLSEEEMDRVIQADSRIHELLGDIRLNGFPEPEYESVDADEQE